MGFCRIFCFLDAKLISFAGMLMELESKMQHAQEELRKYDYSNTILSPLPILLYLPFSEKKKEKFFGKITNAFYLIFFWKF